MKLRKRYGYDMFSTYSSWVTYRLSNQGVVTVKREYWLVSLLICNLWVVAFIIWNNKSSNNVGAGCRNHTSVQFWSKPVLYSLLPGAEPDEE